MSKYSIRPTEQRNVNAYEARLNGESIKDIAKKHKMTPERTRIVINTVKKLIKHSKPFLIRHPELKPHEWTEKTMEGAEWYTRLHSKALWIYVLS